MNIYLGKGIESVLFGMKREAVNALLGEYDSRYFDEDKNEVWVYNQLQIQLSFYSEEDFRLGYIIVNHPNACIDNEAVMGISDADLQLFFQKKKIISPEKTTYENTTQYFDEQRWVHFYVAYDKVFKIEIGALFNPKEDAFDWKV